MLYLSLLYAVYEETAGLTVNDPVLRTKKVKHELILMGTSQANFCFTPF